MQVLEKLNEHLRPVVEAHQDFEIAFEYRPSRHALVHQLAIPTGRRTGGHATVTLTIREEGEDGRPGKLLTEATLVVREPNWYQFSLPSPVEVLFGARYFIGITGSTSLEQSPLYPVLGRDGEPEDLSPSFEPRFLYVLPAHLYGGAVFTYFVNKYGDWNGPYSKCFIGRTYGVPVA
jgi:hypothetical protein